MIQIEVQAMNNAAQVNDYLRQYPRLYPKRHIIGVSMVPNEYGWFMTITYEVSL